MIFELAIFVLPFFWHTTLYIIAKIGILFISDFISFSFGICLYLSRFLTLWMCVNFIKKYKNMKIYVNYLIIAMFRFQLI